MSVAVLRYIWSLKWSLLGSVGAVLGSFLSLGMLGYVLYYLAYPVVASIYPPLTAWRGDVVWPLIVGAGVVWSPSFLVAGVIDHALLVHGVSPRKRSLVYLFVLWVGAAIAWSFTILNDPPPLRGR